MLEKMNEYGTTPPEDAPMGDMEVDLGDAEELADIVVDANGDIVVQMEAVEGEVVEAFDTNLATLMDEADLNRLGAEICEKVEEDLRSRAPWYERYAQGLRRLGVYDAKAEVGALGTAEVNHPLLLEAATQFQARAMAELYPPSGPVKGSIPGKKTQALLDQAVRIEQTLNYELTVADRTYYDEQDSQLLRLAFSGSEFQKVYDDPLTGRTVSRWVKAEDFIVPYSAGDLRTTPRYTHCIPVEHCDYKRFVKAGRYREVDLCESGDADADAGQAQVQEALDTIQGEDKPALQMAGDTCHRFYETHIDMDLKGFEHDVPCPYVVTVDKETQKVLAIYRNWQEGDEKYAKRQWFTHRKFLPGLGFYGFGLIHCIGGLGETATQLLRILLDAGAFATLQGGFKSKDAKLKGNVVLQPGVWQDCEMTSEELSRAFYTPPFKEPSEVLFRVLGLVVESGQRFAATQETMVGDAATTGPVGTMVAQIEQGSKVFSGIHKRLHKALGDEFILYAELYGENMPEVGLRDTDGGPVMRSDFDGRVDVVPVSDPNIFSSSQRIAMGQTAYQMAVAMPDLADRRLAAVELLRAMRFPNPERIFPDKQEMAERADPVTEGSLLLMGRPLQAYFDQNHGAHIRVHMLQMQQLPPPMQAGLQAHVTEHMAMDLRLRFQQMLGAQLPPMNFMARTGEQMVTPLPPEVENQIAMMAAQGAQQIMQQQQAQQQAEQAPAQQAPAEDSRAAEAEFMVDQQRKDAAFAQDQQRKDAAAMAEVDRKDAMAGLSPTLVKQAGEFIAKTGVQMSPRELALLSKVTGQPFADVVARVARLLMAGQGGSQFQQTEAFNRRDE